jgi:hypothetical protein
VAGTVLVRVAGSTTARRLSVATELPLGSQIDARAGVLTLTTARDTRGHTQSATLWSGVLAWSQRRTGDGTTTLILLGGHFADCKTTARQVHAAAVRSHRSGRTSRVIRGLWAADHHGRFSTRGMNSVATVRGTVWATVDRCDGTLTSVKQGTVRVKAKGASRSVLVTRGHSYLARAR